MTVDAANGVFNSNRMKCVGVEFLAICRVVGLAFVSSFFPEKLLFYHRLGNWRGARRCRCRYDKPATAKHAHRARTLPNS